MIKLQVRHDVAAAVSYFLEDAALSKEERTGVWVGSGCAHARIPEGTLISATDLTSMLSGRSPRGERLGEILKPNRRAAWDCIVTPDKSISLAALCLSKAISERIKAAFKAALAQLLHHMESLAYRQAPTPGNPPLPTNNLIAGQFLHQASRHADPHLHAHLLIINATHCEDLRWRAIEPAPLYRSQTSLRIAFNARLHRELQARGFASSLSAKNIASLPVPKALCDIYSKAHNAIIGMASRILDSGVVDARWQGLSHSALVDRLNDRSRPKQRPAKPDWESLFNQDQKTHLEGLILARRPSPPKRPKTVPTPSTLIRRAWFSLMTDERNVRRCVEKAVSNAPDVPVGTLARAAMNFRSRPVVPPFVPTTRVKRNHLLSRRSALLMRKRSPRITR